MKDKEKVEDIKAFLVGELSLDEMLEIEDKTLWDWDLGIAGFLSISSEPKNDEYEFTVSWENKEIGITGSEAGYYIQNMENLGFEDAGITGGPVESEIFTCSKCKVEYNSMDIEYEEWEKLQDTNKCPKCGEKLEYERVYEHVHMEGTKNVKVPKTEVQKLVDESETIEQFTDKLLEKIGLWEGIPYGQK